MKSLNVFQNELREIFSNIKFNILIYIIMPFLLAFLNGIISARYFDSNSELPNFNVSIINNDKGQMAAPLKEIFESSDLKNSITLREDGSLESIEEEVQKGEISAVIIVPNEFSDNVFSGKEAELQVIKSPAEELNGTIVAEVVSAYTKSINSNRAVYETLSKNISDPNMVNSVFNYVVTDINNIVNINYIQDGTFEKNKTVNAKQYYSVTMLIMFSVFLTTVGASNIIKEKENGTLKRLQSTSISKVNYMLGKLMAFFLVAVTQIGIYIILTSKILKINWGDNIGLIIIMILAHAIALSGITALAGVVFKTQKALRSVLPFIIMIMAVFGGTFFSIDVVTGFMRNVIKATINFWLTNGYTNIMVGSSLLNINTNIIVLLAIGIIGLFVGTMRFRFDN